MKHYKKILQQLLWLTLIFNPPLLLAKHLTIQTEKSEIRVLVYKGGLFTKLGHNHVLHTNEIEGQFDFHPDNVAKSKVSMSFPLSSLVIDNSIRRKEEGDSFPGDVPKKDIVATRKNLMGKVLDAIQFPKVEVESIKISGTSKSFILSAKISLQGEQREVKIPITVEPVVKGLIATGQVQLLQSDFGIKPLSVFLGAIAVQDEMLVKFKIYAE